MTQDLNSAHANWHKICKADSGYDKLRHKQCI